MILYPKVRAFLENQKRHLLALDDAVEETGFLTKAEQSGEHFKAVKAEKGVDGDIVEREIGLMEMVYDNAIDWAVSQAQKSLWFEFGLLEQAISEDTTTSDIATFTTALLPAVRRIYASLIAMELVSVQPLPGPSGYIYWLDHKYTSEHSADGISALDRMDQKGGATTYFDSTEKDATMPEIEFGLTSKLISTEIKKVITKWTIEAEQDLKAQWKLNLESELMPELSNGIIREVDRKIINALVNGAGAGNVNWSVNPPAGDTTSADKNAYYQTLFQALALANSYIFQAKYRNANWLLMNGNTYYYFQRLEQFNADPHAIDQSASIGRRYVGTLAGLYKVYLDPWFADNKILMGVKGGSWKEAVAYYAPYIPLFLSDKFIYNNDFTQFIRGAMTRYAYGVLPETSTQSPVQNNGLATITLTQS